MMRAWLLVFCFACGIVVGACSPSSRETVREVAPPAQKALCILLRALTNSGTIDEVCATLDELAPFVPEILARRESGDAPPGAAQALRVAAAFEAPSRPVPRRRCVQWVDLASLRDAGTAGLSGRDAAADAAAAGATDGGR